MASFQNGSLNYEHFSLVKDSINFRKYVSTFSLIICFNTILILHFSLVILFTDIFLSLWLNNLATRQWSCTPAREAYMYYDLPQG